MEIGPVNNGKMAVIQPDGRKEKEDVAAEKQRLTDDVRISAEAREWLQNRNAEEELRVGLEKPVKESTSAGPEMVRLIRERIDTGFYERDSIKDETVEKLIDQMLENINQFYK